jgi:MFS family permease
MAEVPGRGSPLRVRAFRLLAGGQFTSTVGDYCYAVALPWLVLSAHGGTVLLGAVLACYGIPRTVLIPAGGVLSDKVGARTLMLAADAARCVLVAVLAVLAARHVVSLAMLGPIAALTGAGEGLFLPASFAIMPSILDADRLAAGNALSSTAVQAGSLAGPALGGALVAVIGPASAFAVDAASFAFSAVTLALIRRTGAAGTGEAGGAPEQDGKPESVRQLIRRSRALQVILLVVVSANLASGGMGEVALPSLAHASYGAAGYGALLACLAAGGMAGTLAATRAGRVRRPAIFISWVFLAEAVAICLVPYAGGEPGAAAALLAMGALNGLGNVSFLTLLQHQVPPALLGRVMGAIMLCAFGSFPLSVAVTGVLVGHLGAALFFPVAGGLVGIAMLGGLTQREFRVFGTAEACPGTDQSTGPGGKSTWRSE